MAVTNFFNLIHLGMVQTAHPLGVLKQTKTMEDK